MDYYVNGGMRQPGCSGELIIIELFFLIRSANKVHIQG